MSTKTFWSFLSAAFLICFLAAPVMAEDVNVSNNPDYPNILVDNCVGDYIKFVPSSTLIWPGDGVSIDVQIANDDTLNGLHLHAVWSQYMIYDSVTFWGSAWSGTHMISRHQGNTHLSIDFGDGSATIAPHAYQNVCTIWFRDSLSAPLGQQHRVNFGDQELKHMRDLPNLCYLIRQDSALMTTVPDTTRVIIGSANANSSQGTITNSYKDDYPIKIPVNLYSNYSRLSYDLVIKLPYPNLVPTGFESHASGVEGMVVIPDSAYIRISGANVTKPPLYDNQFLGYIIAYAADFRSQYMGDLAYSHSYSDTLKNNPPSDVNIVTHVYTWFGRLIPFASITPAFSPTTFPKYDIDYYIGSNVVQSDSTAQMDVAVLSNYFTADYKLFISFSSDDLKIISFNQGEGLTSHVDSILELNQGGTATYLFYSNPLWQSNKYGRKDTLTTLFGMQFKAKRGFSSTPVYFTPVGTYTSWVYDWFSPDSNAVCKIRRDHYADTLYFRTWDGTLTWPGHYISGTNDDLNDNLPYVSFLEQNYPNPFNSTTMIRFSLDEKTNVQLDIIDILGRHVKTVASGVYSPGQYMVTWDGKNLNGETVTTGTYFYTLTTDKIHEVKKMVFLK